MPRQNANIRIVVGASLDRDAQSVLTPLVASVQSARAKIESEFRRAGRTLLVENRKATKAAAAHYQELAKGVGIQASGMARPMREASAQMVKDAREHTGAIRREYSKLTHAIQEELERVHKAEQKTFGGAVGAPGGRGGDGGGFSLARRRNGRGGGGGLGPALNLAGAAYATRAAVRFATRTAADIAEGAGVDFGLSSHVQKNVELQSHTVNLSNQAYIEGADGAAGTRQDPRDIEAEVRSVAAATASDTTKAVEGLEKFVAKTGDLETGRKIFREMAVLAKAMGADLSDMEDAAGDVANQLGNIPNKAAMISWVMKGVAAQGKIGAVEMRDLASQMAKVASSAGQIEGDPARNIKTLSALAQIARAEGGAANAWQATTSVQAFVNTLKTPARAKAFQAATGKSIYNEQGLIRDPEEIIIEALRASGKNPLAFKQIFANVQGAKPAEALATIYRRAGGGDEGERQVREAFRRFAQAALDDREILESFHRAMGTSESQAQTFNLQLQAVVAEMQAHLLPALVELGPTVIAGTRAIAQLAALIFGITPNETTDPAYAGADRATRDVRLTHSQRERGFIDPRQLTKNKHDEDELRKAIDVERASLDVDTREAIAKGQNPYHILKDFAIGTVGGMMEGRLDGGTRYTENKAQSLVDRKKLLEGDEKRLQNLVNENAEVADLLRTGVIRVKVVSSDRPPPGADRSGTAKPEAHVGP
ncbi:phage tail tape measure protein [Pendulispora brunnea]|uniref:Phage tail tape measure protein n=1 Tax=Pendulispora brunnea TaxID=2905690 RepID=A0ABZ2KK84_9BACT